MSDTSPTAESTDIIPGKNGGYLRPWKKGFAPNPTGTNGEYHVVRKLCAEKSVEATMKLIALLNSDDDRLVFMASQAILERGVGKPRDHSNETPTKIDLTALSPSERATMAELLRKVLGG